MDKQYLAVSIPKWTERAANEDAASASAGRLVVCDGAGGCGVFAGEWAQWLVSHLSPTIPLTTFEQLDKWVDGLWEEFYDQYEQRAKAGDGMLLNKFYAEGSCATVAVAWKAKADEWTWMTYGDSVVFHYNLHTGRLEHSFSRLADFSQPPHLVSCKDPLDPVGFRSGTFHTAKGSVVFAASDALAHYLLMMYALSCPADFATELSEERTSGSANAQLLRVAETMQADFAHDVIRPLLRATVSEADFTAYLQSLWHKSILDVDDCTLIAAFDSEYLSMFDDSTVSSCNIQ